MNDSLRIVMDKMNELLKLLLDGSWHTVEEVAKSLQAGQEKIEMIAELLEAFNFIQFERRNLRITYDTKEFLDAILEENQIRT